MGKTKKTIFTMMPFHSEFNDVWNEIKQTISSINYNENHPVEFYCIRLDEVTYPRNIIDNMMELIRDADICIADVTGGNPNVMFEIGYAYALNKPVILLIQNSTVVPFDISTDRQIRYERNNLHATLSSNLRSYLLKIMDNIQIKAAEEITFQNRSDRQISIALTGSMRLDTNIGERRVEILLSPYIGKGVVWYVGSYGDADELAIEYLCQKKEKIVLVGYTQYDLSSKMLDLVNKYKLSFVDVSKEQAINIADAPSHRDAYFKQKADLSIFLWDGLSPTTKKNIEWSLQVKKDFIIGFIPR